MQIGYSWEHQLPYFGGEDSAGTRQERAVHLHSLRIQQPSEPTAAVRIPVLHVFIENSHTFASLLQSA